MVHELIQSVGASSEILELFLSFCQRTLAVEEGFSSAPFVKCSGDILGMFTTAECISGCRERANKC